MDPALVEQLRNDTIEIVSMDLKARIARSFTASYQWNVCNLEGHWYGRSAQVWHDLASHFPDMIVVPQYPLWLTHEDQDNINEDGEDERDNEGEEIDSDEEAICKGTVGSEAGDLSEPAVRLKSHKLTTIWQEVQNVNIKQ